MKLLLFICAFSSLFLFSCNRTSEKNIQASKDYALVQADLSYVVPMVIHAIQSQSYLKDKLIRMEDSLNTEATFEYVQGDTVNISNQPVKFNITYAQSIDLDGRLKNGSLSCTLYEYFDVDQAKCRVLFDAFSISNYIVNGTLHLERINGSTFEVLVDKLEIIIGTRKIHYEGLLTYTIGTGMDGSIIWDNIISVLDQGGQLSDIYGVMYDINTPTQIYRELNCRWISKGIVEIKNLDGETQVLDFGSGSCEEDATVTNADTESIIQL